MPAHYVGYGNDKLAKLPRVAVGDKIECTKCGKDHELEAGRDSKTGEITLLALFYKCGEKVYVAAIDGRLIVGVKACCSGEI